MKIRETFNTAAHIKELELEVNPNGITCNLGIKKNYQEKKYAQLPPVQTQISKYLTRN